MRVVWFGLALLVTAGGILPAQQTPAVRVGSRIRVQPQGDTIWHVGILTGVARDTLRLQPCKSCVADVYTLASLSAVDVSLGRQTQTATIVNGAWLEAVAGIGSGWLFGWLETRGCRDGPCGVAYVAIPIFGLAGLFTGATIGSLRRHEDWQPAVIR